VRRRQTTLKPAPVASEWTIRSGSEAAKARAMSLLGFQGKQKNLVTEKRDETDFVGHGLCPLPTKFKKSAGRGSPALHKQPTIKFSVSINSGMEVGLLSGFLLSV